MMWSLTERINANKTNIRTISELNTVIDIESTLLKCFFYTYFDSGK